jgi:hypothetical protein
MMESNQAREITERFLAKGKEECLQNFQLALQKIAHLPFCMGWRAQQIAEEALGWGPYWSKGFVKDDRSPKTLTAYYWRYFRWRIFGGSR